MKKKPQICFDRFPEIFDCRLVHGMNVVHHFPRHIHQTLTFGVIERGSRLFEIAGQTWTASTGDSFVVHPGEAHRCDADAPHDYRALSLSFAAIRNILNKHTDDRSPHFAPPVFRDEAFAQMFLRFSNEAKRSDDWFRSQTLLIELLDYALAHFSDSPEQSSFSNALHSEVRRIRQYLEAHFDEPIRLDTLAEVAGLSPYYLNRIFQAEVGVPPYEYLVKIRLRHAQEMLSGGHSIAEAAHHSGFADQSHLTRFFKKHIGMTPGAYRHTHAAGTSAHSNGRNALSGRLCQDLHNRVTSTLA